eukprot:366529-Chlamydomonas_euryale.AAC.9
MAMRWHKGGFGGHGDEMAQRGCWTLEACLKHSLVPPYRMPGAPSTQTHKHTNNRSCPTCVPPCIPKPFPKP